MVGSKIVVGFVVDNFNAQVQRETIGTQTKSIHGRGLGVARWILIRNDGKLMKNQSFEFGDV